MNGVVPLYHSLCPLCGGPATSIDIELHASCEKCVNRNKGVLDVLKNLIASSEIEFSKFFEKVTGYKPWGAQKHWLRRLLRGENTVLVAPTGIGKTTLLMVYALYMVIKGKRVLYITPTRSLLSQVCEKLVNYSQSAGLDSSVVTCYDSSQSKRKREEVLERVKNNEFKLLVLTSSFLLKNHGQLLKCTPDIVVVDDVDSLLKSERSVRALIRLLGYSEKAIEIAKKRASTLWRILVSRAYGKDVEELVKEYLELDRELEAELSSSKVSQLVVASATGKSRGFAGRLLKDLLKVDLTGITIYGRNITDTYALVKGVDELITLLLNTVKSLGGGCVVYVSPRHPLRALYEQVLESALSKLEEMGFKVASAKPKTISEFAAGKLDILVGYSTYYGIGVRGIDAPLRIKYVVFLGTPVISVPLESFLTNLNMLSRTLIEVSTKFNKLELKKRALEIRRKTLNLSPSERRVIRLCLMGKIPSAALESAPRLLSLYEEIKGVYLEAVEVVKKVLDQEHYLSMGTITLVRAGERYLALIPDTMTYIQASGRASRLVGNKMTHGLSLVIELEYLGNLVRGLEQRLRAYGRDLEFKNINELPLEREREMIEASRGQSTEFTLSYRAVLLVVESPTKAKTIAKFFGKPSARRIGDVSVYTIPAKIGEEVVEFNVVATRGHLFDLATNSEIGIYGVLVNDFVVSPIYTTIKKCRVCGTQFVDLDKCPKCNSLMYSDSKYVIEVLRKLAMEVDEVYIATDPDLEGEKIAYDVYVALSPYNKNIWRIELHEITVQELLRALRNKRHINRKLVEAEMYRRILDRFIGFALSEKLQAVYEKKSLGAGRVQTPVLGLIIDRYRDHLQSKCKKLWIKIRKPIELSLTFYLDKAQRDVVEALASSRELTLLKVSEEIVEVQAKPPYTTDELLADASRQGIPVDLAMKVAQDLFEAGLITYHRTDCTYISSTGINVAKEYLSKHGLEAYFKPSHWGEPCTHEAIRPVYPLNAEDLLQAIEEGIIPVVMPLTGLHLKLYDLVFKRFMASQMKSFKATRAKYTVIVGDTRIGEIDLYVDILENGFNLVAPVKVYDKLRGLEKIVVAVDEFKVVDSSKVPLYSSGDVVILMKRLGIGRPSTYSKILSSIRKHGYVVESKVKKKLIPTKKGITVYTYLNTHYPDLISINVTRKMETMIDKISRGEVSCLEAIQGVLSTLISLRVLEPALIPSLNLNSNVGLNFTLDNVTTN